MTTHQSLVSRPHIYLSRWAQRREAKSGGRGRRPSALFRGKFRREQRLIVGAAHGQVSRSACVSGSVLDVRLPKVPRRLTGVVALWRCGVVAIVIANDTTPG